MATESLAVIGATISTTASSTKSCADGSVTNILTLNIPSAGVWLISGYAQINSPGGTSNVYILSVQEVADNFSTGFLCSTCYSNISGTPVRFFVNGTYEATGAITLYLNIYQSSGSSKEATYRGFKATRIA